MYKAERGEMILYFQGTDGLKLGRNTGCVQGRGALGRRPHMNLDFTHRAAITIVQTVSLGAWLQGQTGLNSNQVQPKPCTLAQVWVYQEKAMPFSHLPKYVV